MQLTWPRNIFAWAKHYGDDLGYEPRDAGRPTRAIPGSSDKVEAMRRRVAAGQAIFHEWDPSELHWNYDGRLAECVRRGDSEQCVFVGRDNQGRRHRYLAWRAMKSFHTSRRRMLYITAGASWCDSWKDDQELAAIHSHAILLNASSLAVCPLMTLRSNDPNAIDEDSLPCTELGSTILRAAAKQSDLAVLCFGDTTKLERWRDAIWILSKTIRRAAIYYSAREPADGLPLPTTITRQTPSVLQKFPFKLAIDEAYYDQ